jgi:hypothetical protein
VGGVAAIAISHPHYYTSMVDWSHAFGKIPIYLRSGSRGVATGSCHPVLSGRHIHSAATRRSSTAAAISRGTALHWAAGAEGRGLLTGDILR